MKKRKRNFIIFFSILALLIIPNILVRLIPSKAKRMLPESAMNVQEKYEGCVFYDFSRTLKASLSKEDYLLFIKNYGGLTKYDPGIHTKDIADKVNCYFNGAPDWWADNSISLKNCYFFNESKTDYLIVVKYFEGWLYFFEVRS